MPTSLIQDTKFKWIMWSLIFFSVGFLSSPTIVSLYHISIIIPMVLLYKGGEKLKIPKSGYFLLGIVVWGIVCNFVNFDELVKTRKAFDELKFYLLGLILIVPIRYFFQRASNYQVKRMLNLLSIVVIVAFIVGCSKAFFGFNPLKMEFGEFKSRSDGLTNYMRYGYASAFLFVLGLGVHLNRDSFKNIITPKLFYTALLCCFFAVFAAKTRGALLGMICGCSFLALKFKPKLGKALVGIGAIFIAVVLYISFTGVQTSSRFLNIKDGSNKKRMSQFYSAVKSIQERPVFGVGISQFSKHVTRIKIKYDIWSKEYVGHSHNIFLEHAANLGILGAILLLGFLVTWGFELYGKGAFGWVILSYLVAYVVSGQVENLFDNTNSHLLFFIYSISNINFKKVKIFEEII